MTDVEIIRWSVKENDKFEFSSNVTNTARLFNLLQDTEGVIFVTRDEYNSGGGGIDSGITFEGLQQDGDLRGSFFYNATRLTGGRVGTRGIEVHVKFDSIHTEELNKTEPGETVMTMNQDNKTNDISENIHNNDTSQNIIASI